MVESRSDRAAGHAENLGELGRLVADEVAKDENRALLGHEPSERTVELVSVGNAQQLVGRSRTIERKHSQVRDPAALTPGLGDAHVGEQPVHPSVEAGWIAEARQITPGDHQRVLQSILGPSDVPEDPVGDREEPVAAQSHQVDECDLVTALRRLDEIEIHAHHRGLTPVGGVVRGYRWCGGVGRWKFVRIILTARESQ